MWYHPQSLWFVPPFICLCLLFFVRETKDICRSDYLKRVITTIRDYCKSNSWTTMCCAFNYRDSRSVKNQISKIFHVFQNNNCQTIWMNFKRRILVIRIITHHDPTQNSKGPLNWILYIDISKTNYENITIFESMRNCCRRLSQHQ